jgi:hypothetical protein
MEDHGEPCADNCVIDIVIHDASGNLVMNVYGLVGGGNLQAHKDNK